ncbi:MAG TPA: hypothetical protein VHA12_01195 [Candidatus Nanoarchaeia archaeon]|nr:hypothetical protein [Candidatus Nanoarchaeia archaeon]
MNLGFTGYRTQNQNYHPFILNGHDVIAPTKPGYEEKRYLVIGFLAPERKLRVGRSEGKLEFRLVDQNELLKEVIPGRKVHKYLEKTPRRGRRIVGRLINDKGRIVSADEPDAFLITEPIEKIYPEPGFAIC